MSSKRKTKVEHCKSPKGHALRQFVNQIREKTVTNILDEKQNEVKLLENMSDKMGKIMKAYLKLQEQNKRKDEIIKQLENQNLMLKQRIVGKSTLGESRLSKSQTQKQSTQGMVIQRTFTPIDIKKPQTIDIQKEQSFLNNQVSKPIETFNPNSSIVQEYNPKLPSKILTESRSQQKFNKTLFESQMKPQYHSKTKNQNCQSNQRKEWASQILNNKNSSVLILNDDKSFMDVLSKLKQKIQKFDEQETERNKKQQKNVPQQEFFFVQNNSLTLSKVKSSENFSQKSKMKQSRQKQQLQALRKIWDQRDQQIKRMDELFSKIDERLNI